MSNFIKKFFKNTRKNKIAKLEEKIEGLFDEHHAIKQRLQSIEDSVADINYDIDEVNDIKSELEDLQSDCEEYGDRLDDVEYKTNTNEDDIYDLQNDKTEFRDFEKLEEKFEDLESQVKEQREGEDVLDAIKCLKNQVVKACKVIAELLGDEGNE